MKAEEEDKAEAEEAAADTNEERKGKEERARYTAGEEEERKEISLVEKTVSIRLCNYSMLMRA